MGKVQLNSTNGSITLTPQDGSGNVDVVIPREQLVGISSLATKQNTLVSGTNIKTINDSSILGNGNVSLINLSGIAAYHLLQGNLAVSNYTITQGFNTTLYTGNGGTQSINTGIDMSTQWGNDVSEKFGGLVWGKSRSNTTDNALYDTIRGVQNYIFTNSTSAQTSAGGNGLSSFNSNGFSVGNGTALNTSAATYASWNFQTTHRVTGTTNHGKAYTCHFNPFTGFTMVKYEGSGLAGHEIPHHLGRKLEFVQLKNLVTNSTAGNWDGGYIITNTRLFFNTTAAYSDIQVDSTDNSIIVSANPGLNDTTNNCSYILYGWANSYFDKSNKLIGNYEIGVYQGTGVAGNKVSTRGKPALLIRKAISTTGNWLINDNQRSTLTADLYLNVSNAESDGSNDVVFNADGFTINGIGSDSNTSGVQYLYMVAYDTNSNGGGTYYPLASDTANLQVNNALIPIAQGIDSNGVKNTILSKNETFSGVTYTQGKNYVYYDVLGNKGVSAHRPRYLDSDLIRGYAGESPDYYNVKENKWYSTNSGSELVTNGTFDSSTTGWTAYLGATLTFINGVMRVTRSSDVYSGAQQQITTEIGKRYRLTASINKGNDNFGQIGVYSGIPSISNILGYVRSGINTYIDFIAQSTITYLSTSNDTNGLYAYFDNISVFPVEITPTAEIPEGRNYLNHIVHADNDGGLLYVEELPKTQYIDSLNVGGYNINFSNSLFTNGYQKLPSGLILQWGLTPGVSAGSTVSVTFPISFPTTCLQAFSGGGTTASNAGGSFSATTTTGGTFYANTGNNGQSHRYFAIGY